MSILSQSEIAAYRTDGVLVPELRLPPAALTHLQSLAARLIADNPHMGHEPVASPHVPGSGVQNVKSDPAWIDIPTFPPILDMMEQIIGPDVILWGSTLFHKPAGLDRGVPWHRDGRYWPIKPLATTSVWIAATDCTKANGCLRVVPGSHAAREIGRHFRDHSDRVTIPETLCDGEFDPDAARDLEACDAMRTGGHPERIVSWPHLNRVAGLDDYYVEEERYRTAGDGACSAP